LWTTVDYSNLPAEREREPVEDIPSPVQRRKSRHTPRTRAALAYQKLQERKPVAAVSPVPREREPTGHRRVRGPALAY
jgi:hypothetical protein